ncbi:hypothetical protein D3C83_241010 [compost metagenome]
MLAKHPGPAPVELALGNGGGARFRSRTLRADATNGTLEELQAAHPDLAAGATLEEIFLRMAAAGDPPPPSGAPGP